MSDRQPQRPLAIADLLAGTAVVAVALALCRAANWSWEVLWIAAIVAPVIVHAVVLARSWRWTMGLSAATIAIATAWSLALVYGMAAITVLAIASLFVDDGDPLVEWISNGFYWFGGPIVMIGPHWIVRVLHAEYRQDHDEWPRTPDERPGCLANPAPTSKNPDGPQGPAGVRR